MKSDPVGENCYHRKFDFMPSATDYMPKISMNGQKTLYDEDAVIPLDDFSDYLDNNDDD